VLLDGVGFVGAGFMPAFKFQNKNSLFDPKRGHKARAYKATPVVVLLENIFQRELHDPRIR
jgi:hypothetical protein